MAFLGTMLLIFLIIHLRSFWYEMHFGDIGLDKWGNKDLHTVTVSAFQNISAELLQTDADIECDVLVAGDFIDARSTVISLAEDAGLTAWHAGPLCNSAAAEALTSILIAINKKHSLAHSGIKITGH